MQIKNYPLKSGQWVKTATPKKYVVWHGTTGRTSATPANGQPGKATSTIDGWNSDPAQIGTPWVVDRDGTIFKTFDDRQWIYHLGIKNTNGKYDKSSVGIEIANEVDLRLDGDKLYAFGKITPNTRYVGKHFVQNWRGGQYWASLDEAQVDACIELTLDICNRFSNDRSSTTIRQSSTFQTASPRPRYSVTQTAVRTKQTCCYSRGSGTKLKQRELRSHKNCRW